MLRQARSTASERNPRFTELVRDEHETNIEWGERAVAEMETGDAKAWTYIALLGGSDSMSFRLRTAQSHVRSDMLPSYWSESILVELSGQSIADAHAVYVPLIQPDGLHFSARTNGVVRRPLTDFEDPKRFPNIALIALPIAQNKIFERVKSFCSARSTLDALEHVLRWLAFVWGVARTGNPLHDNYGLPSACMLETVCSAVNFDLTPGLEARASCPEAIWVAALFWQEYYEKFQGRGPVGRHYTPHQYPIEEPARRERPASPKTRSRKK